MELRCFDVSCKLLCHNILSDMTHELQSDRKGGKNGITLILPHIQFVSHLHYFVLIIFMFHTFSLYFCILLGEMIS